MKNLLLLMLLCSMISLTNISAFAKNAIGYGYVGACRRACSSCNYCGHCNLDGSYEACNLKSSLSKILISRPKSKSITSNITMNSQCKGTTKKGARCRLMVKGSGDCYPHRY